MVENSCSTTLPSVRSPCDIWWPNTATRVGHHLDRTIQVRDMETAWVPLSGALNASSLCSLTSDPPQVQIGGGPPHSCSQSLPVSLPPTKKFGSYLLQTSQIKVPARHLHSHPVPPAILSVSWTVEIDFVLVPVPLCLLSPLL